MTRVALQALVAAGQWILRLLVMIEAPTGPAVGIVTSCARRSQASRMMFVLVAADAGPLRVLERGGAVTFFARHCCMKPDQWKSRYVMIERDFLAPPRLVVALGTAVAELPLVRVVLFVTTAAGRGQLVLEEITLVAGIAFHLGMPAEQREFRRFGVIEPDFLPRLGGMACLAFGAVPPAVHVLHRMAVGARGRQPFVDLAYMAGCASDFGVGPQKGKFGFAVIKWLRLLPCHLAMATLTRVAEIPFVGVVLLVTSDALNRGIAELHGWRMATGATRALVCPLDLEVCELVLERFPIELHDVGASTLMIGMTRSAFAGPCFWSTSVKTTLAIAICGHVLVAAQAQLCLPRLGEWLVTIGTVFL